MENLYTTNIEGDILTITQNDKETIKLNLSALFGMLDETGAETFIKAIQEVMGANTRIMGFVLGMTELEAAENKMLSASPIDLYFLSRLEIHLKGVFQECPGIIHKKES
ncbi:MAG: hypothetical protein AAGU19_08855 [Prolixibacteraceae bacterium]